MTQFDGELLVLKRDSGQIESVGELAGRTLAGAAVSPPFVYAFHADAKLVCSCVCWNYRENVLHWETPVAGYVDAITLSGSTVLLAPNGDSCLALSADNGEQLWQRRVDEIGDLAGAEQDVTRISIAGAINVVGRLAVFGVYGRHVVALDVVNGMPRWTRKVGVLDTGGLRCYADGDTYLIDEEWLYRIATNSGEPRAAFNIEAVLADIGIHMTTQPAISDGFIYIGGVTSGTLAALDTTTGALCWTFQCKAGIPVSFAPVLAGETLFVVDANGTLYTFRGSP